MDAKTIIHEYEAHQALAREKWQHEHEEEEEHKHHSAALLEKHLRIHVLPLLTQARAQVHECGYPCTIEEEYTTTKPAHLLRLTLQVSRHRIPQAKNFSCALSFLGNSDALTCKIITMLDDVTTKQESPMSLEQLTTVFVEPRVEKFLKGVFHK